MSYVFDTSSLMAVLLDEDSPDIGVLFDQHVLDLTFYEAGNVVWKAVQLQDRIDGPEAKRLVGLLSDLHREVVVHDLSDLHMEPVFRTAIECEVTYYDAAHVTCADVLGVTLVTEDGELRDSAGEMVDVCDLSARSG